MTFKDWIEKQGHKTLAKKMRRDPSSISSWKTGRSMPTYRDLPRLVRLMAGDVTFEDFAAHFAKPRRKK